MRILFYRPDEPAAVVGTAVWKGGGRVEIQAEDEGVHQAIERIFRPTPVVVDDPSLRSYGTTGPVSLPPGSLPWFRAAGEARGPREELAARFVPEAAGLGWDPAGAYRTFNETIERMEQAG